MPEPLRTLTAIACPLVRDSVDTDALIPTSENTRAAATGYGDALFASWRYRDLTSRTPEPDFVLNQPPYDRAGILLSGRNFGCGSSRESAVWALRDFGFRMVIAEGFNETFQRNCIRNGVAPLVVARTQLSQMAAAVERSDDKRLHVDLRACRITMVSQPSIACGFVLDAYDRDLLLRGLTEDDLLRELDPAIATGRRRLLQAWPWLAAASEPASGDPPPS